MPPKKIRILLVDDHECVRVGLRTLLKKEPTFHILGEASNAAEALAECQRLRPDIVVMDIRLGQDNGIEACREIRSAVPKTKVIFLTSYPDDEAILSTVTAGAEGFLLKEIDVEGLTQAIKTVMAGRAILDPIATQRVQAKLMERATEDKIAKLSYQEQRVLALVAAGRTNKEIADKLDLSYKTVKNYVSHIFEKLSVTRRSEATALFIRHSSE